MLRSVSRLASQLAPRAAVRVPLSFASVPAKSFSTSKPFARLSSCMTQSIDDFETLTSSPLSTLANSSSSVDPEDDYITVSFDSSSHNIVVRYSKEFDYKPNDEEVDDDEAEEIAFHPVTATLTPHGNSSVGLSVVGEMHLEGDLAVSEITPLVTNADGETTSLRTIAVADLDEDASSAFFSALETAGLATSSLSALSKHARVLRIQDHIAALEAVRSFADASAKAE